MGKNWVIVQDSDGSKASASVSLALGNYLRRWRGKAKNVKADSSVRAISLAYWFNALLS